MTNTELAALATTVAARHEVTIESRRAGGMPRVRARSA